MLHFLFDSYKKSNRKNYRKNNMNNNVEVKRLNVDSFRGGNTYFEAVSEHEPSKEEIAIWQTKQGYNPLGYSGPYSITIKNVNGKYVTTWCCYNSCD